MTELSSFKPDFTNVIHFSTREVDGDPSLCSLVSLRLGLSFIATLGFKMVFSEEKLRDLKGENIDVLKVSFSADTPMPVRDITES
jgi:hypothetical protein